MEFKEQIQAHMPIRCKDNNDHGKVDHLDGDYIKVAKDDSGQHHWIPLSAVDHVDEHVHLKWGHQEVQQQWLSQDPHPEHRS
ncbi:DUF2171 domain-containing protein [Deinococcus cellulosilyticus]|uniref:DUF2171 domain-containing protein n=1 Tax=Deinococcus cellulosilyticus (strain DSM 18568 / NBRC 106333 / KACC 11606 / 5516J-15) TaxID=1223518 RepID=A0A511N2B5_DEIC1|nr:DUF2171 domain-containing protein [Deinococcus cellulosilyticus]GEM46647.1 hypothetical protein DC3_22820 [Deinococcus cellulosilyticus NBRC 106333 = KACC 11606]